MTIELLAGNGFENALDELKIPAKCTYNGVNEPYYQVWEIDKEDMRILENVIEWPDEWGWWRFAKGSNMGTACSIFEVNGHELIAWDGFRREDLRDYWSAMPLEEKAPYSYLFRVYEAELMPKKYDSLLEYFYSEVGASTETNICALAVHLARTNGMSMAKLLSTYEG